MPPKDAAVIVGWAVRRVDALVSKADEAVTDILHPQAPATADGGTDHGLDEDDIVDPLGQARRQLSQGGADLLHGSSSFVLDRPRVEL